MISAIIPAYRCAPFLEESVRSALGQAGTDMELLLIEDCSGDDTLELARALAAADSRIRLLENPKNLGVAESRNRGIREAKGEFLAFLDADDVWEPGKLEGQLALLARTGAGICYTGYSFIDRQGNPIRRPYLPPETADYPAMLAENVIGLSTAVVRRAAAAGVFMRQYAHEDYVYWLELLRRDAKAVGLPSPLVRYRITGENRSGDKGKAARNRWHIYREFLGMSPLEAARWFGSYAIRGLRKHGVGK